MSIFDRARKAADLGKQGWRFGGDPDLVVARQSELSAQADRFERLLTEAQNTIAGLETEVINYRQFGGGRHDLTTYDHSQMLKIVLHLYRRDHMARRLMQIIVDFVIGDQISVQAKAEKDSDQDALQATIDEFWYDPVNQMDRSVEEWCNGLNLWGEICLPVQRNETNGMIRLGWIAPEAISKVVLHPFTQRPYALEIEDGYSDAVGTKPLKVVNFDEQLGQWAGDAFFRSINTVVGQSRGVSELYTSADWFDVLDQTMKYQADRVKILNSFIWDVELEDYNDEEVRAWLAEHKKAPQPNTIRAHNQKVKWSAVSPTLNSYETANHTKLLRTHILGGWGYPNHWFGDGGDANLATAAVMAEPTRKALRRKQRQFRWLIQDVIRLLLDSSRAAGREELKNIDLSVDPFTVQIPDFSGPDIAKVSAGVAQMTAAIATAEDEGYLSHDTAQEMFASIAAETGFDIDPSEERGKIEADIKKQLAQEHEQNLKDEERLRAALQSQRANSSGVPAEGDDAQAFQAAR